MRLLWLPDVLREAGLTVHLYDGWSARGAENWGPLRGVICHATASARTSTDAGDMRVLWVTGSVTAPAPISQLFLSRSGDWWVGASGRCNHVLVGDKGPHKGFGNYQLIGIEAQNDNRGEPWSAHMLDSYQRGVAAICRRMGWSAGVAVAHREHQSGKSDPVGIDMNAFRGAVAAILTGNGQGDDDMAQMLVRFSDADDPAQVWLCDGMLRRKVKPEWVDDASIPGPGNGPITNAQAHQALLLGNLSNQGGVFTSVGDPDVWGVEYPPAAAPVVGEVTLSEESLDAVEARVDKQLDEQAD